jgi:hypothetical protein
MLFMIRNINVISLIYLVCLLIYIISILWVSYILDENLNKYNLRGSCKNEDLRLL